MNIKTQMVKYFVLSGLFLVFVLIVVYKSLSTFIVKQEVSKARLLSHSLLYTRSYLAKVSVNAQITNKNFHPFSLSPAYAVGQIAKNIEKNEHIFVIQTSDKYRNKDNKPDENELRAIEYYKKNKNLKEFFEIHKANQEYLNFEHIFYTIPLRVDESCLKCHGDKKNIDKKIYKKIVDIYGDSAFGYKVGDVRGIISIKIPLDKTYEYINSVFFNVVVFSFFLYLIGLILFLKLNSDILADITTINNFLKDSFSTQKFKTFKDELRFKEFDFIKTNLNLAAKSIKKFKEDLFFTSYHHSLTKLPNRKKLLEVLENQKCGIVIFDIDEFKEVNYYYGENLANRLILKIVERFGDSRIFHIKIDQFVMLVENDSKDKVYSFAEAFLQKLEAPYFIDDYEIILKFRAGICTRKNSLSDAISALDATKLLNKDIVLGIEAESIKSQYKEHLNMIKTIKKALDSDKIYPFFQPIFDKNENIMKYEALVRLEDENKKILTPNLFLDVASKARFYPKITKRVFDKVLEIVEEKKINVSMNISTSDIENITTLKYILEKLESFKFCNHLSFEIVESEDIKDLKNKGIFFKKIKKFGCEVLIDDFGSGYANFDYLFSIGANGVKIDGSLIKNILHEKNSRVVVQTIVNFTKEANLKIFAEYVENREIFEFLKEMGIDYFQGYYFSKPIDSSKLI